MRKVLSIGIVVSIMIIILAGLISVPVQAKNSQTFDSKQLLGDDTQKCSNLDVIMLIDQSDSMLQNDPTEQRKNAVIGMIDMLVDLPLNNCRGSFHRLGVVSFGSIGMHSVDLPLTDINPRTPAEAQKLRESMKSKIHANPMGDTYPEEAFTEAYEMFQQAGRAGDGQVERKKVIIFVSDGFPCEIGLGCNSDRYDETTQSLVNKVKSLFSFTTPLADQEACLKDVRKSHEPDDVVYSALLTECTEKYPVTEADYTDSTYIYTIHLRNGESNGFTFAQQNLEFMSAKYGGEFIPLNRNAEEVPTTMRLILSDLAGVQPKLLSCGPFIVNPYLQKYIITAYKSSEDINIKLSYTDGKNVSHTIQAGEYEDGFTLDPENGYTTSGSNERYEFTLPYPGIWNLESTNCSGIQVFEDAVDILPKPYNPVVYVPKYDREPFYNEKEPFYLEYQLQDQSTNEDFVVQADNPIFAIDITAVVKRPDGVSDSYQLDWNALAQSFKATEPLKVPLAGKYSLSIKGESNRSAKGGQTDTLNQSAIFNQRYSLFDLSNLEFTVGDFKVLEMVHVEPADGEAVSSPHETILKGLPLKVRNITVSIGFKFEGEEDLIDLNQILSDPANAVTATFSAVQVPQDESDPQAQPIVLPEPTTITLTQDPEDPTLLTGVFRDNDYEGPLTITYHLNREAMSDGYYIYNPDSVYESERTDCLLCRPKTYFAILAILIIAFILMVIKFILDRIGPLRGYIVFLSVAGDRRIPISSRKNHIKLGKRYFVNNPEYGIRELMVRSKPASKRNSADLELNIEPKAVRVSGRFADGRKINEFELQQGNPQGINSDGSVQIAYEDISDGLGY